MAPQKRLSASIRFQVQNLSEGDVSVAERQTIANAVDELGLPTPEHVEGAGAETEI